MRRGYAPGPNARELKTFQVRAPAGLATAAPISQRGRASLRRALRTPRVVGPRRVLDNKTRRAGQVRPAPCARCTGLDRPDPCRPQMPMRIPRRLVRIRVALR